ncbi:M16 family metallopeptidase [Roseicitreum antarcticum]|uniref:Zinc protease n=1 Tax=Roseicitreum antarcticum TaxID=564137 RepID=A0A1H2SDV2_9RHOB|nr:pitrilysin family protein [Roseicitreum antarcticum]SDW29697.1 zinc protease [Roseicitreum antarcticum]
MIRSTMVTRAAGVIALVGLSIGAVGFGGGAGVGFAPGARAQTTAPAVNGPAVNGPAAAPQATDIQPTAEEGVSQFTLDNGMEVVVIEDRRAPVAVHMVWYRVGAADEPVGKSGIAHFLEHLMFKGTDTTEAGEFSATVEAQGGRDNAFTSWDYTGYFQRVAADRLELMMQLEADRMTDLAFTDADWQPELSVILEERGQVLESRAGAVFNEQLRAALFQNHPYGTPIIGWRHEMEDLTGADAMAFYARHYGPNNAVLVVAGDVDAETVRAMAQEHYGPIAPNPDIVARSRPQEPPQLAERRVIYHDARIAQPYVSRQYLAPRRDSGAPEDAAALQVLAALLGGSPTTSVLERRLNFDEGVALSTWASYSGTWVDDAIFAVGIMPVEGVSLEQAEAALDRAIAGFLETGVDADQLARVQTQIRASEIYGLDDTQSRAREYGAALSNGLTVADVQEWPAALMAVTEADVMEAARQIFDRRAESVTGWAGPPPEAADAMVPEAMAPEAADAAQDSAQDTAAPDPAPDAGAAANIDAQPAMSEEVTQ